MDFEKGQDRAPDDADETFIVRFTAWEGPIEAMLDLARSQKIDLAQIDILDLVEQFQQVVHRAMSLRIELAADWLVMASWMAYLKSRVLLRRPKGEGDQQEPDEDVLAFHLKRLDAIKRIAEALPGRLVLGRDWFAPGSTPGTAQTGGRLAANFRDLLAAYPRPRPGVVVEEPTRLKPFDLVSVDAAISRLSEQITEGSWTPLLDLVPRSTGIRLRSDIASSLIGSLELARGGRAEIRQDTADAQILIRKADNHAQ